MFNQWHDMNFVGCTICLLLSLIGGLLGDLGVEIGWFVSRVIDFGGVYYLYSFLVMLQILYTAPWYLKLLKLISIKKSVGDNNIYSASCQIDLDICTINTIF